jgi:hypothetical protein
MHEYVAITVISIVSFLSIFLVSPRTPSLPRPPAVTADSARKVSNAGLCFPFDKSQEVFSDVQSDDEGKL